MEARNPRILQCLGHPCFGGPPPDPQKPRILQCLGRLAPLARALVPRRPPSWHRKTSYFTVSGPPWPQGAPRGAPPWPCMAPQQPPWGPQQPHRDLAGPCSGPAWSRKPRSLYCRGPPWPRGSPTDPQKPRMLQCLGAWPLWGIPWCSQAPQPAPKNLVWALQAAQLALKNLTSRTPGQTLAPGSARGRPHTGEDASQGDRRYPSK